MLRKNLLGMQFVIALAPSLPCLAQEEIMNNQPVAGELSGRESKIQAKLKDDYNKGLIDSDQLCIFQRDLDGICVDEDEIRSRAGGMTDGARKGIIKRLDFFEANLDKAAQKSDPGKSK